MIRALEEKRGELDGSWHRTKKTKDEHAGDVTAPRRWYLNPSDNPSQCPLSTSAFGALRPTDEDATYGRRCPFRVAASTSSHKSANKRGRTDTFERSEPGID